MSVWRETCSTRHGAKSRRVLMASIYLELFSYVIFVRCVFVLNFSSVVWLFHFILVSSFCLTIVDAYKPPLINLNPLVRPKKYANSHNSHFLRKLTGHCWDAHKRISIRSNRPEPHHSNIKCDIHSTTVDWVSDAASNLILYEWVNWTFRIQCGDRTLNLWFVVGNIIDINTQFFECIAIIFDSLMWWWVSFLCLCGVWGNLALHDQRIGKRL